MCGWWRLSRSQIHVFRPVPGPVAALGGAGEQVVGFTIKPISPDVAAPISGELFMLHPAHHAFAIRSAEGLEVLVHFGRNTAALAGVGFATTKVQSDHVEQGEVIIAVDLAHVGAAVADLTTTVRLTNMDAFRLTKLNLGAAPGAPVLTVKAA